MVWEDFLTSDANFQFRPVLIHGDLGGEHILLDRVTGTLAGVIDWGDACVGDPALDFAGLLHGCGRDFACGVLAGYGGEMDEALRERVVFYARIVPFHEVMYGLFIGDEVHVHQGLESLRMGLPGVSTPGEGRKVLPSWCPPAPGSRGHGVPLDCDGGTNTLRRSEE